MTIIDPFADSPQEPTPRPMRKRSSLGVASCVAALVAGVASYPYLRLVAELEASGDFGGLSAIVIGGVFLICTALIGGTIVVGVILAAFGLTAPDRDILFPVVGLALNVFALVAMITLFLLVIPA